MKLSIGSIWCVAALATLFLGQVRVIAQTGGDFGDDFGGGVVSGGQTDAASLAEPIDISAEIRQLRRPRGASNQSAELKANDEPVTGSVEDKSSLESGKIEQLLSRKNTFDFLDTPLSEVADWMKAELECPIVFDEQALEDENIDPGSDSVTFKATNNMSYRSALYHMLRELNLTYTIDNEVLSITSEDRAEETVETHVYPVWDLVKPVRVDGEADYNTLIKVITTTISPNSWDEVGGPGSITAYKGMLTIMNTRRIHANVADLLRGLRSFPTLPRSAQASTFDLSRSESKDAAAKMFSKSMSFQFLDTPLSDVAQWIQDRLAINVLFDRRALEDEAIDPTSDPITIDVSNVSLRAGLDLMLGDLNLTHVVSHEAIVITSAEVAEQTLRTKVYSCDGMIDVVSAMDLRQLNAELVKLGKTITDVISVNSWDVVGGPASIATYPARGLLVISQTDEVHGQIDDLFDKLRRGRSGKFASPKPRPLSPSEFTVRSYKLSADFAKASQRQLIGFMERLLRETDNAVNTPTTRFSIEALAGHLVVSHRRDAQEPIHRVLQKLDALARNVKPIGGMSGGPGMF